MSLSHVELHIGCPVVLIRVTVDALSVFLARDNHVVVDVALVEVGEVTLTDAEHLVSHIRGEDETIGDIWVDFFLRHIDVERCVCKPFSVFVCKHCYLDTFTLSSCQHIVPVAFVDQHLVA